MVHAMLRARRIELGLTQREVAALAGTSQSHFQEWESGRVVPVMDGARRWAAALRLRLSFDLNE